MPNYIDINVINYINKILETMTEDDFDEKVFRDWLEIKDIEFKNNPNAYIKSCFKKELEKGTYKPKAKVEYVPNTQELINELRDRGMCILADESVWLSVVWGNIINIKDIDIKACKELNHKIIEYMGESKSFNDYKKLLMNSNTLKPYNINWGLLEEKTKLVILGWDKYLDELALESEE